jgi:hypothetical protein
MFHLLSANAHPSHRLRRSVAAYHLAQEECHKQTSKYWQVKQTRFMISKIEKSGKSFESFFIRIINKQRYYSQEKICAISIKKTNSNTLYFLC